MSTTTAFSPPKVQGNLRNAFGGVFRLTWHRFTSPGQYLMSLGVFCIVLLVAGVGIPAGQRNAFVGFTVEFYLTFLVPVMAFLSGGGAIRDEMKGHAVDYILTRPVPRWAFVVFRYIAQLVCVELVYLLVLAGPFGVGFYKHIPDLLSIAPLLLATQVITVAVFMSFGFLCGVLTSRYLVVGLIYGAVVEVGISRIPIQLSALSMTHHVRTMLHTLLDDSSNVRTVARRLLQLGAPSEPTVLGAATILICMAIVMVVVSATLFSRKELAGARPSDT